MVVDSSKSMKQNGDNIVETKKFSQHLLVIKIITDHNYENISLTSRKVQINRTYCQVKLNSMEVFSVLTNERRESKVL